MTENLLTVLLDDGRPVRVESLKWIVFELGHGDDSTLYSELAAPDSTEMSRLIETLCSISKRKLRKRMDFESSQTHTTSGRPQSAKTNLRSQDASRPTRSAPIGHRVPPINSRA
jgi:hypothetical protein